MREYCIVCYNKINRGSSKIKMNRSKNSVTCSSDCSKEYKRNKINFKPKFKMEEKNVWKKEISCT